MSASCSTRSSPPARRGRASSRPARRCASSTSAATRPSTACSTTPPTPTERYSAADTIVAQRNIFLVDRHACCCSNEGAPMMTDHRHHVRLPRHDRRGLQPGVEHAALRPPHRATSTPASTTSSTPARATGSAKRDLVSNINWFMNVPVGADGTLGIVDGISAPGLYVDAARRDGRARADLQLPADQQPVQRLRPDAGPRRSSRRADVTRDRRRRPRPAAQPAGRHGRGARRRAAHHGAGPARADRLLARRRAAERADGRPRRTGWSTACVGNAEGAAALELTGAGPDAALRRAGDRRHRRRGRCRMTVDGAPVAAVDAGRRWPPARRSRSAPSTGPGLRAHARRPRRHRRRAVPRQPLDVHARRASAATRAGRSPAGDVLPVGDDVAGPAGRAAARHGARARPRRGSIGVLVGPHTAPDFLTAAGLDDAAARRVGGALQLGPHRRAPRSARGRGWARADGGEAGLHPSNIHDTGYAIGAVDLTGDMPIILGPDGPSLGGFVCPAVVAAAERWKLGQLAPGRPRAPRAVDAGRRPRPPTTGAPPGWPAPTEPVEPLARPAWNARRCRPGGTATTPSSPARRRPATLPAITYRQAGDRFLLVEYGADDARPRAAPAGPRPRPAGSRDHLGAGVVDATAGVRSLLVQVDGDRLTVDDAPARAGAPPRTTSATSSDAARSRRGSCTCRCRGTTRRPARRSSATCTACAPTRRGARGTSSSSAASTGSTRVDDVHRIVFDASYLVLGLGDVYLGAPVATPLDPRHRLVTTKYNPARTWTPENAVGIGGAYLCIYGMEGPGGYQFVGRTVQVWNRDAPRPALPASRGCCARSTSCAGTRWRPTSCSTCAPQQARGRAGDRASRRRTFRLADHRALPRRPRRRDRRRSAPRQQAAFAAERAGVGRRRRVRRMSRRPMTDRDRRGRRRVRSTASPPTGAAGHLDRARRAPTSRWPRRRDVDAAPRAGGVDLPLAGHDARRQGQHRRRRAADDRRLPGVRLRRRRSTRPVVARADVDAGAVVVGKTNLDQFATGLVGTRSPYGDPARTPTGPALVSGGSSSGSAVAVAAGHGRPRPRHRHRRLGSGAGRRATASSGSSRPAAGSAPRASCRRAGRSTACRCSRPTSPAAARGRRPGRRTAIPPTRGAGARRPTPAARAGRCGVGVPDAARPDVRRRRRTAPARFAAAVERARRGGRDAGGGRPRRRSSPPARLLYDGAFVAERYEAVGAVRRRPSRRRRPGRRRRSSRRPAACRRGRCSATGPSWPALAAATAAGVGRRRRARRAERAAGPDRRRGARRPDRRQLDARHLHELREPARPVRADGAGRASRRPAGPPASITLIGPAWS